MTRRTKYGASPTIRHFLAHTEMEIVRMIDYRAVKKKKAHGTAIRLNISTLKKEASSCLKNKF